MLTDLLTGQDGKGVTVTHVFTPDPKTLAVLILFLLLYAYKTLRA